MKIPRVCFLVLLSLLWASLAFADGIQDPKIVIRGVAGGNTLCPKDKGCTPVGSNFTFSLAENKDHGVFFFTNNSGKSWTSLKLIENGIPASAISCQQSMFVSCKVTTLESGAVEILLSGVNDRRGGISAGTNFSITLGCVDGNCWKPGMTFTAHATGTPEPGTIALVATGIGAIVSRRKRWKNSLKV